MKIGMFTANFLDRDLAGKYTGRGGQALRIAESSR